jgi:tRNA-specific 2-thiouridylase
MDFLRFPLGGLPKPQVRALAQDMGLINATKPDSQDICFVPDGDYASVVRKVRLDADTGGEIVHIDGRVLGEHKGLIHYTIGQRKGLEIGGQPVPLYVVKLDADTRRVIVGPRSALATRAAQIVDLNWIGGSYDDPMEAKVRSLARKSGKLRVVSAEITLTRVTCGKSNPLATIWVPNRISASLFKTR